MVDANDDGRISESDIGREELAEGRDHLTVTGTFQSDKYLWCPAGFVPLKLTDPAARDLLREYARRRGAIDSEFDRDLNEALANVPDKPNAGYKPFKIVDHLRLNAEELADLKSQNNPLE